MAPHAALLRRCGQRAAAILVALCWLGFDHPCQAGLQTRMIFPGHITQGRPEAQVKSPAGAELVTLSTAHGDRIAAIFGTALTADGEPHPDPSGCPTILFFYGNGMCLNKSIEEFQALRRLGANVLIPEYVGYGLSTGRPSERGCYQTADAAYAYLLKQRDGNRTGIVLAGWSLGSAVAIDLASRRPVAGIAIFSGFTSMGDLARQFFPYFPTHLLIWHRFESERKIASIRCPTLIVHGRDDPLIPVEMADRLAAAAGGRVTRLTLDGAQHNDVFLVGAAQIHNAFRAFLETIPPDHPSANSTAARAGARLIHQPDLEAITRRSAFPEP